MTAISLFSELALCVVLKTSVTGERLKQGGTTSGEEEGKGGELAERSACPWLQDSRTNLGAAL